MSFFFIEVLFLIKISVIINFVSEPRLGTLKKLLFTFSLSFSLTIFVVSFFSSLTDFSKLFSISPILSPLETLSPTLRLIFFIIPSNCDGISKLDLSLSRVIRG